MRRNALALILFCGLTGFSYAATRLAAQTTTQSPAAPYSPLPLQASGQTVRVAWQSNNSVQTPSKGKQAAPKVWNSVVLTNPAMKTAEGRLNALKQQLATARTRLTELVTKRATQNLPPEQRAILEQQIKEQQKRLEDLQRNVVNASNTLELARIAQRNLLQGGQRGQWTSPYFAQPAGETPIIRNLLFTPQDAALVKLMHPLLTPETQATLKPLERYIQVGGR
jgi:hypothetical protein